VRFAIEGKRLRTVLVLVTLALSAYFSARGVTSLVAGAVLPPEPVAAAAGGAGKASGQRPPGSELPDVAAILARNVFDPTTGPLPKAAEPTEPTEPTESLVDEPVAEGVLPPPCDGAVKLVATVYQERTPEWSFASMTSGSEPPMLYRVGGHVGDKDIVSIYPKAVYMRGANKRLCSLVMFVDRSAMASAAVPPPVAARAVGDAVTTEPPAASPPIALGGGAFTEAELDSNIKSSGETKFSVARGFVDKVLQNQAEIMRSARIVPHEENGQVVGVKLYGIRRNSLLGKLGLQNGDLLRTINGFAMSSPDTALEAYSKLRTSNNLSVAVVRRGRPMNVEYDIQ
jgi:general secretion pathway protein C